MILHVFIEIDRIYCEEKRGRIQIPAEVSGIANKNKGTGNWIRPLFFDIAVFFATPITMSHRHEYEITTSYSAPVCTSW